jgi:hypothetical protein
MTTTRPVDAHAASTPISDGLEPSAAHGRSAAASLAALRRHFTKETTNDVDQIMPTMKGSGELHTAAVMESSDGTFELTLCRSVDEQRAFYRRARTEQIHLLELKLFTTVGSDWYGMVHGMGTMRRLDTGEVIEDEILGLCPVTKDHATMSGEIGFARPQFSRLTDAAGLMAGRLRVLEGQNAYVEALQARDVDGLRVLYSERPVVAVRDYLEGGQAAPDSADAVADYWSRFFRRFPRTSVELVARYSESWYAMCELYWEATSDDGTTTAFRTAELFGPDPEGHIAIQVGWGTPPSSVA